MVREFSPEHGGRGLAIGAAPRQGAEAFVRSRSKTAITRLVLEELARGLPRGRRGSLSDRSTFADAGLDASAFLDVVARIEGRYEMRFHDEWLRGIQTCGDLVDCIARHMVDAGDPDTSVDPLPSGGETAVRPRMTPPPTGADPFPEIGALEARLRGLEQAGLTNPFLRANERVRGRTARIGGRDVISFTSFDYLGLTGHPDVTRAAKAAIDRFGCSASASRMVGGNNTLLDDLDRELASFLGTERATVFPCGYGTNASVFNHLFGAEDLILYDELAHNSIVQGAGASKAGKRPFRHNDHNQLDGLLRDLRPKYRRVVVAIEGVYSMDGD